MSIIIVQIMITMTGQMISITMFTMIVQIMMIITNI